MVLFIIPAYNEEKNIAHLLTKTSSKMAELGLDFRIYVINDGSTDSTGQIIEELKIKIPIVLINQEKNRGVGEAFRVGFREVLRATSNDDIIITKEADNTSDIEILEKMITKVRQGYDVVLASCFCEEGDVINATWDRHLLSFCANNVVKFFFNMRDIHTFSSFYRAFNGNSLKNVFRAYRGSLITRNGFECMVEMLIKLKKLPVKIAEIPLVLDANKNLGKSKMKRKKTIQGYIKLILHEVLRNRTKDKEIYRSYMKM